MSGEKDWASKQADLLLDGVVDGDLVMTSSLKRDIADALRSERARWSAFAGVDGEPRRVLGDLPVNLDGDVVGNNAKCWNVITRPDGTRVPLMITYRVMVVEDPDAYKTGPLRMHSNRAAALAAKKEAGNGK